MCHPQLEVTVSRHDARIIAAIQAYAAHHGIRKERFEFRLLYGARPDLQRRLVREGYNGASTSRSGRIGRGIFTGVSPNAERTRCSCYVRSSRVSCRAGAPPQ